MSYEIPHALYTGLYGPGEGDLVALADTNLRVRVERNLVPLGEEGLIGAGRNIRDGMVARASHDRESALDACIKSVLVIDPVLGVVKGDIGIKDGRIVGVGHAGNPDVQDGVDMILDTNTSIVPAAGLIATPGALDCHVHLLSAALLDDFVALGYTTLIGGGSGLVFDVGTNPRYTLERMFEAFAGYPLNVALIGRASSSEAPLEHALEWGASGFKIHEDLGAYPAVIDTTLRVADAYDVQAIIHTDTINEAVTLEETIDAIAGRTIHAYHVEGAGGGHAPDLLEIVRQPNVLPSSTNPTNPYTAAAVSEALDMILSVHLMNPQVPEDVAFAQSRVRPDTMAAEDLLHDLGAISMMGADTVGMGRAGETVRRTWQVAHAMKQRTGDNPSDDNDRVLRYLAKYTINPAIAHGIGGHVGSLEPGKLADVVLWRPGWFGVKPEVVLKDGLISAANTGQGNGATVTVEPMKLRPMFGSIGGAPRMLGHVFSAAAAADNRALADALGPRLLTVGGTRKLGKRDMVRNSAVPDVRVDRQSARVTVDGELVDLAPVTEVPMSRRYLLV
ncbi:MAG: urease subunit alpha [Blastocatellia bacterium]|jgi:urease subunit alpha|nr:urease subunit alpha [Blastocatellia bacterium]